MENKVVIITGVSKGIGYSLCQLFLKKGSKVIGLGNNSPDINHQQFEFFKCDVRDAVKVEEVLVQIYSQNSVDILINNAGLGYFGPIEKYSIEQWKEMFDVNVHGIFHTCRIVVPKMKEQRRGHIINISSIAGLESYPEVSGYCGTKFAVKAISQSLHKELRDIGIKVSCVYPGSVKTDFFRNSPITPHDYMLDPNEVANAIYEMANSSSNFLAMNLEIRPLQPKGPQA